MTFKLIRRLLSRDYTSLYGMKKFKTAAIILPDRHVQVLTPTICYAYSHLQSSLPLRVFETALSLWVLSKPTSLRLWVPAILHWEFPAHGFLSGL